jgi:flagellar basal body rod protein FlgG
MGMNVGLYRGAAAMQAIEQQQEAVAQNLSAASVPGFKKTDVTFSLAAAEKTAANPAQ